VVCVATIDRLGRAARAVAGVELSAGRIQHFNGRVNLSRREPGVVVELWTGEFRSPGPARYTLALWPVGHASPRTWAAKVPR
jgi:hypothetical protein